MNLAVQSINAPFIRSLHAVLVDLCELDGLIEYGVWCMRGRSVFVRTRQFGQRMCLGALRLFSCPNAVLLCVNLAVHSENESFGVWGALWSFSLWTQSFSVRTGLFGHDQKMCRWEHSVFERAWCFSERAWQFCRSENMLLGVQMYGGDPGCLICKHSRF